MLTGDKLKNLRLKKGLTQKELAQNLKASLSVVCDVENNRRTPSKKIIYKLAKFFDTSTDYWFQADENSYIEKFFYFKTSVNRTLANGGFTNGELSKGASKDIMQCLTIDLNNLLENEEVTEVTEEKKEEVV